MVVNDHYNNLRKPIYRQTRHFSTSIVSFDTIYQRMGIKSSCCFSRDSIIEPGVGASLKAIHRGCKKRLKKLLSQNYEQSTNIETSNTEEDISAKNPVGIMKLSLEVAHSSSILTTAALAPTPVNTESRCLSPTDSYETLDRHSDTGSLEEIPLDESSLEYEEPGQPAVTRLAYSIATPLSEFVVTQPLTYLVGWEVFVKGIGVGHILSCFSAVSFLVQFQDGRQLVVESRRGETSGKDSSSTSIGFGRVRQARVVFLQPLE